MFQSLPPWVNATILVAAAAAVWWAGSRLAHRADDLARRTGLGGAFVGMLLLGGMTSLPELAVAVTATLNGAPLLTVNDVLGSAAVNVLILALADAVHGRGALTSTPGDPQTLLQGTLSIVLLVLVPGAFITGDTLVFGMGAWSWVLLASYALALRTVSRARNMHSWVPDPKGPRHDEPSEAEMPDDSISRLLLHIASTGAVILAGGFLLAETGRAIAEQSGLGTSFVGAVLLGFATSLPEFSTVVAAVRMGRYALAIGDVFGTNLFNVTILVLADALHAGDPVLASAGPFAAFAALLAAMITLMFLVGLIERRDRTVWRVGLDSVSAVAIYIAGVFVLYRLR